MSTRELPRQRTQGHDDADNHDVVFGGKRHRELTGRHWAASRLFLSRQLSSLGTSRQRGYVPAGSIMSKLSWIPATSRIIRRQVGPWTSQAAVLAR
jgi:hypothetical protein